MAQSVQEKAVHITYDAVSGRINGLHSLRMKIQSIPAESGGGRGSVKKGVAEFSLKSRLATTPLIKGKDGHPLQDAQGHFVQRGGPLPPGSYTCKYVANHKKFHECIQLFAETLTRHHIHSPFALHPIPHHRENDFFIHGRGDLGSDGCIVPLHKDQRLALNRAIRDFQGAVILDVMGVSYLLPAENMRGLRS